MYKFKNKEISSEMMFYIEKVLSQMKKGMRLSIDISDNHIITIQYYKN